jgi:hypothetical protein
MVSKESDARREPHLFDVVLCGDTADAEYQGTLAGMRARGRAGRPGCFSDECTLGRSPNLEPVATGHRGHARETRNIR